MRFLHLADVHLDTAFAGRTPDLRRRLREAVGQALANAVTTALEARVDAVLIAGDLLDSERLSFASQSLLLRELERLREAGIPVVYVTGNHDPGDRGGTVVRLPWPDNVHLIADSEPRRIEVIRDGQPVGMVTGAGHPTSRVGDDLSRSFPRPGTSLPQVALLHTQVGGAAAEGQHHRYAPSELAQLRRSEYDYWALGHIHLRQELSSSPPIHYPGNLQGRSPRETGPKGGLLVELSPTKPPELEFVELAPLRWERLRVKGLGGLERVEEVVRRIEEEWDRARTEDPGRPATEWLVRVELLGPSPLHHTLAREEEGEGVAEALAASLGLLDVEIRTEGLQPRREVEPHLDRQDVLGESLRLLRALTDDEKLSPAEELGIEERDLAGYDPEAHGSPDAYLRSLLEGEEPSVVDALLGEER